MFVNEVIDLMLFYVLYQYTLLILHNIENSNIIINNINNITKPNPHFSYHDEVDAFLCFLANTSPIIYGRNMKDNSNMIVSM
jgi:hypothetical protein